MKMLMAIIPRSQADEVIDSLIDEGQSVTFLESRGGMLRQSQLSLFVAVEDKEVEKVISIIRDNCQSEVEIAADHTEAAGLGLYLSVKARLGGSVIFVWGLENVDIYDSGGEAEGT